MGRSDPPGLTFDSGALIAFEAKDRRITALVQRAKIVGELCARSGTSDVVDASVVVAAWTNGRLVVTSDAGDIRRLDPSLTVVSI